VMHVGIFRRFGQTQGNATKFGWSHGVRSRKVIAEFIDRKTKCVSSQGF
jgi:hypothetical protein